MVNDNLFVACPCSYNVFAHQYLFILWSPSMSGIISVAVTFLNIWCCFWTLWNANFGELFSMCPKIRRRNIKKYVFSKFQIQIDPVVFAVRWWVGQSQNVVDHICTKIYRFRYVTYTHLVLHDRVRSHPPNTRRADHKSLLLTERRYAVTYEYTSVYTYILYVYI